MASTLAEVSESQLVIFALEDHELAVSIDLVQEIVQPPAITPIANAPPYVLGISNLRGAILPVLSLRIRLNMEPRPACGNSRVIVIGKGDSTVGVLVDSVSEVMNVSHDQIEDKSELIEGLEGDYLTGVARIDRGERLILILAVDEILLELEKSAELFRYEAGTRTQEAVVESTRASDDEEQAVCFSLDGEEYAVELVRVQEIIRVGKMQVVPKSPDFLKGVMPLRERLLPILDLRAKFGRSNLLGDPAAPSGAPGRVGRGEESRRVIVVFFGDVLAGLEVDSVSEVMRLPRKSIVPPPEILGPEKRNKLRGIGNLQKGKRLLMLLDLDNMLGPDERKLLDLVSEGRALAEMAGGGTADPVATPRDTHREIQIVCFRLDEEEFGLDIMRVQEIIRLTEMTSVPRAPDFIEGIVNLRGNLLPVIDLRKIFGLPERERGSMHRIVVLHIEGKTTGVVVDSVSEVLIFSSKYLEPPSALFEGNKYDCVQSIANLNGGRRMIFLLRIDEILSRAERSILQAFGSPLAAIDVPAASSPADEPPKSQAGVPAPQITEATPPVSPPAATPVASKPAASPPKATPPPESPPPKVSSETPPPAKDSSESPLPEPSPATTIAETFSKSGDEVLAETEVPRETSSAATSDSAVNPLQEAAQEAASPEESPPVDNPQNPDHGADPGPQDPWGFMNRNR